MSVLVPINGRNTFSFKQEETCLCPTLTGKDRTSSEDVLSNQWFTAEVEQMLANVSLIRMTVVG